MKRKFTNRSNFLAIWIVLLLTTCTKNTHTNKGHNTYSISYRVEKASKWTNLFKRNSGWIGGDGIFSIPLTGVDKEANRVMLLFSDTMIGQIINGELQSGLSIIHNSVAYLKNPKPVFNQIHFVWRKKDSGTPASMFIPKTQIGQKDSYYWLGDGFMDYALDNIYIFAYQIQPTNTGAFPFKIVGNPVIAIPANGKPPYKNQRQLKTPFSGLILIQNQKGSGHWELVFS